MTADESAPEWQIGTVEEFRSRLAGGTGVVVISSNLGRVLHTGACRYVDEANFASKVVNGRGRSGRYWWFPRASHASATLIDLRFCSHCVTADVIAA